MKKKTKQAKDKMWWFFEAPVAKPAPICILDLLPPIVITPPSTPQKFHTLISPILHATPPLAWTLCDTLLLFFALTGIICYFVGVIHKWKEEWYIPVEAYEAEWRMNELEREEDELQEGMFMMVCSITGSSCEGGGSAQSVHSECTQSQGTGGIDKPAS